MATHSLLLLIDDIAALLDDIAVLSKITAKKTAGVLGDDLALNAQQVSGVNADRELAVVWAVAKGSLLNKLILVPAALAISAFIPVLITPLLIIGGLFLCYEGVETLIHKFFHRNEKNAHHQALAQAVSDTSVDILDFEKKKIKGAIRTDFILSAEIIAISLGVVADATFATQAGVLSTIAILITIIVYGLVAGIVRLDDWGLYLHQKQGSTILGRIQRCLGFGLLQLVPYLMKSLSIIGTAAMFLVGGGIISHGVPALHHLALIAMQSIENMHPIVTNTSPLLFDACTGIIAGLMVWFIIDIVIHGLHKKIKSL
ncbi:MAG: putative DNA repair protein MutK [Candidatus Endobugula sp.]|jgi:predicted DNA repair protein MutK